MGAFDQIRPGLASIQEAAEQVGVPTGILADLLETTPPSYVFYDGRHRYPLLTVEDVEAATGTIR
jgi:hypothetical protein